MNQLALTKSSATLARLLAKYAVTDIEAENLKSALSDTISSALSGKIDDPLEWNDIPGGYYFTEGNLSQYADLESAYAEFKIEITGGESPILRKLRLEENKP